VIMYHSTVLKIGESTLAVGGHRSRYDMLSVPIPLEVSYRACWSSEECDDRDSNGDGHLELGTRFICHDRPSFSRESFKLLGYRVGPIHPVHETAHCFSRSKNTSWPYFHSVVQSCARNHIHIHLHQIHLNNLIFIYSQYLLLRESRITPFKQSSFRYLTSVCSLVRQIRLTSTSASEPAATKPTFTGKKASASPSHLNSNEPVGFSESMVSISQINAFRSARQSPSPVTDGRELGLSVRFCSRAKVIQTHGIGIEMTTLRSVKC